ncbi:MAG TPA: PilT/PilU family type 4a pilus ATPase [Euzebyales bacterium]|nr:PilT/PilU family type 4a pilus ATPase [Euzebyales bacterium]
MTDATTLGEEQVLAAQARQRNVPFVRCESGDVDVAAAQLLHRDEARELQALPIAFGPQGRLLVAVTDLDDTARLDEVARLTGSRVYPALTTPGALHDAIARFAADAPVDGRSGDAEGLLAYERTAALNLDGVLGRLVELGGSDLHLTVGLPPMVRINGELVPVEDQDTLEGGDIQQAIYGILRQKQREEFENHLELDTSYAIPGLARFRLNVFQQREAMGAVMRLIPYEILSIDQLGIPPQVNNFAYLPRGFVLVTGPTGSGKSTTLASLIDVINRERSTHIMTVEDPIEFLHAHKRSVVNQRELGMDTHSFAAALKHILRQDPDVILVGEMRDLETIQMALTAAETGHLVFGTLHTQDAPQTVDRVIDVFPPHQQEQIRVMLAGALQGVVSQQLVKTIDGEGRVAAVEVMIATPAIRNLIREGKVHQMYSLLQAGKQHGMVTMDQSLADLVKRGVVSYDVALARCSNVADFNRLCGRG